MVLFGKHFPTAKKSLMRCKVRSPSVLEAAVSDAFDKTSEGRKHICRARIVLVVAGATAVLWICGVVWVIGKL
jgi:hypothetical protein